MPFGVQVQVLSRAPEELSDKKRARSFFIRSDEGALASERSELASHHTKQTGVAPSKLNHRRTRGNKLKNIDFLSILCYN